MNSYRFLAVICVLSFLFSGCADMETPKADEILASPLGGGSVKLGMSQERVASIYGDPDSKRIVESSEWGGTREEWFYSGRYSALPVSAGYLSKDLYLYFDGDSLTNISNTPIGKQAKKVDQNGDEFIK